MESNACKSSNIFLAKENNRVVSYFCFKYNFSFPCSYCFLTASKRVNHIFLLPLLVESLSKLRMDFSALSKLFPRFTHCLACEISFLWPWAVTAKLTIKKIYKSLFIIYYVKLYSTTGTMSKNNDRYKICLKN